MGLLPMGDDDDVVWMVRFRVAEGEAAANWRSQDRDPRSSLNPLRPSRLGETAVVVGEGG